MVCSDSVIQASSSDLHASNNVSSSSGVTYRGLTKRESDAYGDALYHIRSEDSNKE